MSYFSFAHDDKAYITINYCRSTSHKLRSSEDETL